MEQAYYSTKEAASLTGASRPVIRTYTDRYGRYFSTEATPAPGQPRRFTEDDLRLIAFVYERTNAGATHDQVAEVLASGALDRFQWQPKRPQGPPEPHSDDSDTTAALIPVERLQAAMALMEDARKREEASREREETLRNELAQLRQELGQAQGELSAYKAMRPRRPQWWIRLFGG